MSLVDAVHHGGWEVDLLDDDDDDDDNLLFRRIWIGAVVVGLGFGGRWNSMIVRGLSVDLQRRLVFVAAPSRSEKGSKIQATGVSYPAQSCCPLRHLIHVGLDSSHLTRRRRHVTQPVRTLLCGLIECLIEWLICGLFCMVNLTRMKGLICDGPCGG